MKVLLSFYLFALICFNPAFAQAKNEPALVYKPGCLYFFARGTMTKRNIIAKDFNLSDTNITHVGLGIMRSGNMKIFHVVPEQKAFTIQDLAEFIAPADIFHIEIWELRLQKKELASLYRLLNDSANNLVEFDYEFDLGNDKLYCSEFAWRKLKELKKKQLHFKPTSIYLTNDTYRQIFKKESISLIPIDFFKTFQKVKLMYSCHKCDLIQPAMQ